MTLGLSWCICIVGLQALCVEKLPNSIDRAAYPPQVQEKDAGFTGNQ